MARAFWSVVLLMGGSACGGFEETPAPEGFRTVSGQLAPPDASTFQKIQFGLQPAAAMLDATADDPILNFFSGPVFSPSSGAGQPVTFRVAVPIDRAVVLFLQSPASGADGVGQLIAPIRFPNGRGTTTDVLNGRALESPVPVADVQLGLVSLRVASESPNCAEGGAVCRTYEILVGDGETQNPLAVTDTDADGTADLDDSDDDDDLIPDDADPDSNGDGIADQWQSMDALADQDFDCIPDRFQALNRT